MTTITVPVSSHNHVPNLPKPENWEKDLNWLGRIIHWIRSSNSKSFVQWTLIHTGAVLVSLALFVSVVGIPILIYAAKESTRQQERARFDQKYENMLDISTENAKAKFLNGRVGPLDGLDIKLKSATRKKILHNLEIKEKDAIYKKDIDLLRMAAAKDTDYIMRYNLKLTG